MHTNEQDLWLLARQYRAVVAEALALHDELPSVRVSLLTPGATDSGFAAAGGGAGAATGGAGGGALAFLCAASAVATAVTAASMASLSPSQASRSADLRATEFAVAACAARP